MLTSLDNERVNSIFAAVPGAADAPAPLDGEAAAATDREAFVQAKYGACAMVAPASSAFVQAVQDSVNHDDPLTLLRCIAQARKGDVELPSDALHLATKLDAPRSLTLLLLNGVDADTPDEAQDRVALHYAAEQGRVDLCRLLLDLGKASSLLQDRDGKLPSALASSDDVRQLLVDAEAAEKRKIDSRIGASDVSGTDPSLAPYSDSAPNKSLRQRAASLKERTRKSAVAPPTTDTSSSSSAAAKALREVKYQVRKKKKSPVAPGGVASEGALMVKDLDTGEMRPI